MECGDVAPLLFFCLAWQRAQKKNRKKQQKQRNNSGVTSPHSIKSANPKLALRAQTHPLPWEMVRSLSTTFNTSSNGAQWLASTLPVPVVQGFSS
jgi:hypothetical protein